MPRPDVCKSRVSISGAVSFRFLMLLSRAVADARAVLFIRLVFPVGPITTAFATGGCRPHLRPSASVSRRPLLISAAGFVLGFMIGLLTVLIGGANVVSCRLSVSARFFVVSGCRVTGGLTMVMRRRFMVKRRIAMVVRRTVPGTRASFFGQSGVRLLDLTTLLGAALGIGAAIGFP
jgi:hypothetical protein